jgi:hypothetical protein
MQSAITSSFGTFAMAGSSSFPVPKAALPRLAVAVARHSVM